MNIKKASRYIIISIFMFGFINSQTYAQDRDVVILSDDATLYLDSGTNVLVNGDFDIIQTSKPDKDAAKIHIGDSSSLKVVGSVNFNTPSQAQEVFNMGNEAYLEMSSNEAQSINSADTSIQSVNIPNLALDGNGNKFLNVNVNTEKINFNNSILELQGSNLVIDGIKYEDVITGDLGFVSNTGGTTHFQDEESKGKLILHLAKDSTYRIPLGVNTADLKESPRILSISANQDAEIGFQMLPQTPHISSIGKVDYKTLEGVNDLYYYKMYNLTKDTSDMKINMDVSFNRRKEGDFGTLAYLDDTKLEWVDISNKFDYGTIKLVAGSGNLQSQSSLVSYFRAINISDLQLNGKQTDSYSRMRNALNREAGAPIVFTLAKNELSKFHIPNVFTPNGDGINDTFEITGLERGGTVSLEIFQNVRGTPQLVYRDPHYAGGWDGGKLPDGVYYYRIKLHDKEYKGDVTIKRY